MNGMSVPTSNWSMGCPRSDTEALDLAAAEPEIVDHPREHHGREQVREQPDAERDREALDGPGAELEQDCRGEQRREMGVEDGAERAVVAEPHRLVDAA